MAASWRELVAGTRSLRCRSRGPHTAPGPAVLRPPSEPRNRPLPAPPVPSRPGPAPRHRHWLRSPLRGFPPGPPQGWGWGGGADPRSPPTVGTPPMGVLEGGMWVQVAPCSAGAPSAVGHSGGTGNVVGGWGRAVVGRGGMGGVGGVGGTGDHPAVLGVGVGPPEAPTQAVLVPLFGGSAQRVGTPLQSALGCRDSSVWGDPTERRAQQGPPPGLLRAGGGRRGPAVLSGGGGTPGSVLALVCAGSPVPRGHPVPPAGYSRVTSGVSVTTPGARPTVPVPG